MFALDSPTKHETDSESKPTRVGLIAGWGQFPVRVARALRHAGIEVYCLGAFDHADPVLAEICTDFRTMGLGRFGAAIRYFQRHGVTRATMAGKIHKVHLFRPWLFLHYVPDLRTLRMLAPHFFTRRKDNRDDTLLGTICDEFASEGIQMVPSTDFAPELLVGEGLLTCRAPNQRQWEDIRFGWRLAKALGGLDCGQSVAVKNRAVLALEAIEGTDACIRRAGELCRSGKFTVVKTAKPRQDMRFDLPTVGLGTLETMIQAGARVLAIEAGMTILLDEDRLVDFADQHKLIIVACSAQAMGASVGESNAA